MKNSKTLVDYLKELVISILFIILIIAVVTIPVVQITLTTGDSYLVGLTNIAFNQILYLDGNKLNNGIVQIFGIISLICLLISIITFIVGFILNTKEKDKIKRILYIVSILLLISYLFLALFTNQYYDSFNSSSIYDSASNNKLFSIFNIVIVSLISLLLLANLNIEIKYSIQEICETAVMVALAVVLDQFAKIPIQANGGSISFSPVPLFIIAIRFGGIKGFISSSLIFGFITCLLDGYGLQTFPFDYFLALAGYGFVGTFVNLLSKFSKGKKKNEYGLMIAGICVGGVLALITRYIGHMISAAILYQPITLLDNFIYQSTYVPATMGISIAAMIVLSGPIMMINKVFKVKKNG